ncbi:sensor histidine kinase [Halomonas daqiaonensis]|uniref:histidine kinase n=1 Tax=Halomonas daqiaonensis TaxID=650850 RepID=A0A1H7IU42_9GAMM|nr:HAMP domain-containing sensor histidine kinase [Halomonas daqiaonensis]SEK65936.1 His Kinase A (phospho-acceptor) domain-containing protein [Halomonas daqiaonensis]
MPRLHPFPVYLVASLAILAFSAFLAFALIRLFQVENDMRDNVDENMLWVVTQAQVASHRLDQAVNRRALGQRSADPELRLDILSSRLTLMDDGPQRDYLLAQGLEAPLDAALEDLRALLAIVDNTEGEARFRPEALIPHLDSLMARLNRIANSVMMAEWESTGARLDTYRSSLLQVIGSVVGITLSGLALTLLLVHALRQRRVAQRALTAHRDQLEEEIARHISRYKETADALARALNRERGVSEFYRSFAAMVSHQFRTPLAVIDSGLQRLQRRHHHFTPEKRSERYQRLREAVEQMTRLVESSLTAARLDGQQVETSPTRHSLVAIVDHLCRLQEEAHGIERLVTAHDSPEAFAWCDRALTEQVLANLISNALKYSPAGQPVRITTALEEGQAVCRVADGGPGIPEAEQARLFERFFRGSNAAGTDGIGLGLNIARHLARIQQGDLEVSSSLGEGSVFTLRLPAANSEEAPHVPA